MTAIDDSTLLEFAGRFEGLSKGYGQTTVHRDGDRVLKDHRWAKEPATEEAWRDHLEGTGDSIGINPLRDDYDTVRFAAIDVDDEDVDHAALQEQVDDLGLPLIVCRSTSGGAHLYLFTSEPVPASTAVGKLEEWSKGLKVANPDGRALETFPKQQTLSGDGWGNYISLPYYDAENTHRPAVIEGQEATLQEFLAVARRREVDLRTLRTTYLPADLTNPFHDGPPCLSRAHAEGIGQGQRNDTLFDIGVYYQLKYGDDWQERLEAYNEEHVDPPLGEGPHDTRAELMNLLSSLKKRDYAYRCPDCDEDACNERRFGRLAAARRAAGGETGGEFREITDLRKYDIPGDPRWVVRVGGEDIFLSTEELYFSTKFNQLVLAQANLKLPDVPQKVWHTIITNLLENLTVIEVPEEVGFDSFVMDVIGEYMEQRHAAQDEEDILRGNPVTIDGEVHFQLDPLMEFVSMRTRHADHDLRPNRSDVITLLDQMGAESGTRRRIKGKPVRLWTIPEDGLEGGEQTEPFSRRIDGEDHYDF